MVDVKTGGPVNRAVAGFVADVKQAANDGSISPTEERRLKEAFKALTTDERKAALDMARQSGFDAVVVKPCDPDLLVQEIERLLAIETDSQPGHSSVESTHNNR